jgi:hypothetical protein
MSEHNSTGANENDLDAAVAIANQYANTILLALRTVHEYIVPRAASHGIKLSARETHAWAVSLSIALSQSKTHYRMPATRLEKPARAQKKGPAKSIQSPKTELRGDRTRERGGHPIFPADNGLPVTGTVNRSLLQALRVRAPS